MAFLTTMPHCLMTMIILIIYAGNEMEVEMPYLVTVSDGQRAIPSLSSVVKPGFCKSPGASPVRAGFRRGCHSGGYCRVRYRCRTNGFHARRHLRTASVIVYTNDLQSRIMMQRRQSIEEGSACYGYCMENWTEFDVSRLDRIYSAPRLDGSCPTNLASMVALGTRFESRLSLSTVRDGRWQIECCG